MEEILEMLRSAEINFENCAALNPVLNQHPMFVIAKKQLADAIELAEKHPG